MNDSGDPIRERRARIARLVRTAKRVGYGALLLAVIAFIAAAASDFPSWAVTVSIVALGVAITILPVPIVLGYGLRAAERDDRQRGGSNH